MPGTNLNNLDAYNEIEVALGGAGGHLNDLDAANSIAVLEGAAGGHLNTLDALNAIEIDAGGAGTHENTLDALNSIVILKGGVGGHENDLDAINEWVDFAAPAGPYVVDNFTGIDGTNLTAHTPDTDVEGGGWLQLAVNAVEIDGNRAGANSGTIEDRFYGIDTPISDEVSVEGGLRNEFTGSRASALVVNLVDTDNSVSGVMIAAGVLEIVERSGGSNVTQASGSIPSFLPTTTYASTLKRSSSTITFDVDGNVLVWAAAPASPTETKHGLFARRINSLIDDFIITDI